MMGQIKFRKVLGMIIGMYENIRKVPEILIGRSENNWKVLGK